MSARLSRSPDERDLTLSLQDQEQVPAMAADCSAPVKRRMERRISNLGRRNVWKDQHLPTAAGSREDNGVAFGDGGSTIDSHIVESNVESYVDNSRNFQSRSVGVEWQAPVTQLHVRMRRMQR